MGCVVLLAGCAYAKTVTLPDGSKGYSIDCSGGAMDMSYCLSKAGELCKGPYRILDQSTSDGGVIVAPNMLMPNVKRLMIVTCGK